MDVRGQTLLSALSLGQVLSWNGDTGISRDAPGAVDIGNGTAGDRSGTLSAAQLQAIASGKLNWAGRAAITSPADGEVILWNNGASGFTKLAFGGTGSAAPALWPSGADLAIKSEDNSFFRALLCEQVAMSNGSIVGDTANGTIQFSNSSKSNAVTMSVGTNNIATFNGPLGTLSTAVSGLPSAAVAGAGARAFVTDANSTTFMTTVVGGGSNKVPVVSDGANWKIG